MKWYLVLVVILLNSCAPVALNPKYDKCKFPFTCEKGPQIVPTSANQLLNLPPTNSKAVVAVYSFPDLTGQRKSNDMIASFSTAVTQGAEHMLVEALRDAGRGIGLLWWKEQD